jgi:hypothetical protein
MQSAGAIIVVGERSTDLVAADLESEDLKSAELAPNEWAPVHSSIAGPYIFVLGEGFLIDISSFSRSNTAWPLRSDPVDMMVGLLATQWGEQLLFTSMRRDLAAEQGHWPEPVASCSSPSVVPTDNLSASAACRSII